MADKIKTESAVFGAGCFWHVQYEFSKIKGIVNTAAGYMGGDEKKYPSITYNQLHSEDTGYAEVVQVEFDTKVISYKKLLDAFWKMHNPTTMNRQGPDIGKAYRSAVFYYGSKQKKEAETSKKEQQNNFKEPIVTEIKPAGKFIIAEEYHQNYYIKTGQRACPVSLFPS